ncbi:MAG: hypothetical protein Q9174_004900 [Haloplaca sp. 1 TL-2023]
MDSQQPFDDVDDLQLRFARLSLKPTAQVSRQLPYTSPKSGNPSSPRALAETVASHTDKPQETSAKKSYRRYGPGYVSPQREYANLYTGSTPDPHEDMPECKDCLSLEKVREKRSLYDKTLGKEMVQRALSDESQEPGEGLVAAILQGTLYPEKWLPSANRHNDTSAPPKAPSAFACLDGFASPSNIANVMCLRLAFDLKILGEWCNIMGENVQLTMKLHYPYHGSWKRSCDKCCNPWETLHHNFHEKYWRSPFYDLPVANGLVDMELENAVRKWLARVLYNA